MTTTTNLVNNATTNLVNNATTKLCLEATYVSPADFAMLQEERRRVLLVVHAATRTVTRECVEAAMSEGDCE